METKRVIERQRRVPRSHFDVSALDKITMSVNKRKANLHVESLRKP